MNAPPGTNVARMSNTVRLPSYNAGSSTSSFSIGSLMTGWGALIIALLVLTALFAVYYETVGYYVQIGWEKLGWSRKHGEKIEIDVPGLPPVHMTPASNGSGLENEVKKLESDVETALGATGGGNKQVFNVSRNLYKFSDAEPLCRAFGAELATYDQVKDAYKAGADWCNYGWVKGQLAVYPTQKATYDKLQNGPESERMSCGLPGVNGGYFPNEDQRFGVNCYGPRPAESALDQRLQQAENSDIAFDREVNHFKAELDSIGVNPWSQDQWSK